MATSDLASAIAERVLVADGAMGTMLQAAGLAPGAPAELWNRERPDEVRAIHAAYAEAGADLILTNSFGGTRIKLQRHGLGAEAAILSRLAAELAREAAGSGRYVLGDLGPTGELLEPLGKLTFAEVRDAYAEQAEALAAGGVDAILVETMSDAQEARAAIAGAGDACALPVICTFSFDRGQRTMMGVKAADLVPLWRDEGLLAIGANCGHSLEDTLSVIAELHELLPDVPLVAKPNAGVPVLGEDGKTYFNFGPREMATFAERYLHHGVRIIGGCCGSTPAHIEALRQAVSRHATGAP